jgi:hypothetical protein
VAGDFQGRAHAAAQTLRHQRFSRRNADAAVADYLHGDRHPLLCEVLMDAPVRKPQDPARCRLRGDADAVRARALH